MKKFKIPAGCIINKADINLQVSEEIKAFLKEENVTHLADIPYDETFTEAMTDGKTIVEFSESKLKQILEETWRKVKEISSPS